MIIPDVNLLVYAYDRGSPQNETAKEWLGKVFNGREDVGLAWASLLGFIRLLSNSKVVENPQRPEVLLGVVSKCLELPVCRTIGPGPQHGILMAKLFRESGGGTNLVTDIHLAALAMEHKGILYSNDTDFGRFPGLQWKNPLRNG